MYRILPLLLLTLATPTLLAQDPPPPQKNIFTFDKPKPADAAARAPFIAAAKQCDAAIIRDEYDIAQKAAAAAEAAAKTLNDPELLKVATARLADVKALADAAAKAAPALAKTAATPDDPKANLEAGRFLCFWRGDWDKGLPLLAKSADPGLKALAEEDLAAADANDPRIRAGVAHAWWDYAAKLEGPPKALVQDRAADHYLKALPALEGVNRALAQKRIAEAPVRLPFPRLTAAAVAAADPSTPFAAQIQIVADDFVCDIFHNGKPVPADKRKLTAEVFGAQCETVTLDLKPGDWVVFNVVNNRLRWGGAYFFAAAGLTDTGNLAFASDLRSGQWSACDDLKEAPKFIADRDHLKDQSPKAVERPWDQGDQRIRKPNPDWQGQPIWGDPTSRSTWLKYIVPGAPPTPAPAAN